MSAGTRDRLGSGDGDHGGCGEAWMGAEVKGWNLLSGDELVQRDLARIATADRRRMMLDEAVRATTREAWPYARARILEGWAHVGPGFGEVLEIRRRFAHMAGDKTIDAAGTLRPSTAMHG